MFQTSTWIYMRLIYYLDLTLSDYIHIINFISVVYIRVAKNNEIHCG